MLSGFVKKTQKTPNDELLKDKEIKKGYDALGPEFALIEMVIRKRIQQGLTQKQLAKKARTKQPVISRFEGGDFSPTVKFLYKITNALGAKLKITII